MNRETVEKYRRLFWEFFRYAVVGGISFLVDSGVLALFQELILNDGLKWQLFVSTAAGTAAGLIVNYILSLLFVFRKEENKNSGKSAADFLIFVIIGVIGLGLTELGMYIGVYVFDIHYLITKVVVAALVLIWNYAGRKIFVFNR